jgi:hypothetical protein
MGEISAQEERIRELTIMLTQVQSTLQWINDIYDLSEYINDLLKTRIDEIEDVLRPKK